MSCVLSLTTRIYAATIHVPADAPTIRAAVDLALDGDEILLADGDYTDPDDRNINLYDRFITIRSASGNAEACNVGNNECCSSILRIRRDSAGLTRIEDLTIRGRLEIGDQSFGNPNTCRSTIRGCIFRGAQAALDIEGLEGDPTIVDCLFTENPNFSPLLIQREAKPLVINCRFLGNDGGNAGAAQVLHGANPTFYNCEFIGNTSSFAGAIWLRFTAYMTLVNCTFVQNDAPCIWVGSGNTGANILNLQNTILWNNGFEFPPVTETYQILLDTNDALPSIVNAHNSIIEGWTGTFGGSGNNGTNPMFVDVDGDDDILGTLDDNTRLAAGSPAIDSGDNQWHQCIGVDLDNNARFEDDAATADTGAGVAPIIDRGAYEYGANPIMLSDCNNNLVDDECEISLGLADDCNNNLVPDACEMSGNDCNGNFILDECDLAAGTSFDCNSNGVLDECDIASGFSLDCNENGVPDECDIANLDSNDINTNGIPDECEIDCNSNGAPDDYDIDTGFSPDCDGNNVPDECDLQPALQPIDFEWSSPALDDSDDCDSCQLGDINLPWDVTISGQTFVAFAMSADGYVELLKNGESSYGYGEGEVDDLTEEGDPDHTYLMAAYDDLSSDYGGFFGYSILTDRVVFTWLTETYDDEEDGDFNFFQIVLYDDGRVQWNFYFADFDDYDYDLFSGIYLGGDARQLKEIARETIPEFESWLLADSGRDCNLNGVPDSCDIGSGFSNDCNSNNTPDECDIASNNSTDCNGNGIPDECEPALADCDNDGTLDVCEPDTDNDGVPDDCDVCDGADDNLDSDNDGMPDACDGCPLDAAKANPGACGCGVADIDSDGDGVPNCFDLCPNDPNKIDPGACGCGNSDADNDGNGIPDCFTLPAQQETPNTNTNDNTSDNSNMNDNTNDDDEMTTPLCGMGMNMGMLTAMMTLAGLRAGRRKSGRRRAAGHRR